MIRSIDLFQELFLKLKQVSKIINREIIEFTRKGFGNPSLYFDGESGEKIIFFVIAFVASYYFKFKDT